MNNLGKRAFRLRSTNSVNNPVLIHVPHKEIASIIAHPNPIQNLLHAFALSLIRGQSILFVCFL